MTTVAVGSGVGVVSIARVERRLVGGQQVQPVGVVGERMARERPSYGYTQSTRDGRNKEKDAEPEEVVEDKLREERFWLTSTFQYLSLIHI